MSVITDILKPVLSIDYETTILDAIESLVIEDKEAAVVERNDQIIGIVNLELLLNQAKHDSLNISKTTVFLVMEPVFFMDSNEKRIKASRLMNEKDVEHLAVTNKGGTLLGVVSAKDLAV